MPGGKPKDDSSHRYHADSGGDRAGRSEEGYRWVGAVLPRETGGRPFLWMPVHFSQPTRHHHKGPRLRWPRVLDGAKATFQRPFSLVAGGEWTGQVVGSLRGTVINGSRRCLPGSGSADVAPGERLNKEFKKTFPPLAFQRNTVHTAMRWRSSSTAAGCSLPKTSFI